MPIMMGGELVGIIAVSGTPDGDEDECVRAGMAKIKDRLTLIQ